MAMATHGRFTHRSNERRMAPRNTSSSASGARSPIERYPQRSFIIMSNVSSAIFGSSGICSCNHTEGMMAPKAATTHHTNVTQGRFLIQCLDASLHFASRNTAITATLNKTVVRMMLVALGVTPSPLMSVQRP